jgi:hypothetical protein
MLEKGLDYPCLIGRLGICIRGDNGGEGRNLFPAGKYLPHGQGPDVTQR